MESSLGDTRKPLIIGDYNGLFVTEEQKNIQKKMQQITRRSQSTDECFNCHIAGLCSWCSAWNYQKYGTFNKRDTGICWMHRAQTLANIYYWNLYYKNTKQHKTFPVFLERNIANKIITDEEYDSLLSLSSSI